MSVSKTINLDANATYGVDPEVWDYLHSVMPGCLNASSIHTGGQRSRALIEEAREELTELIDAGNARIIFTSGASESNNSILESFFSSIDLKQSKSHLITSSVEHPSVLEAAKRLMERGVEVEFVGARADGCFYADDFISACTSNTKLISCMLANNETGDFLPVEQIALILKAKFPNIPLHSDAVQILGKAHFSFLKSQIDCLSLSGHKIGALPGVGAIVLRNDDNFRKFIVGGPQEAHHRAGTENLPGIVSLAYVVRKLKKQFDARILAMTENVITLRSVLQSEIPDIKFNSRALQVLPNTLNLQIPGVKSDDLVVALDLDGILVSSGAACASGKPEPSHVLLAMGISEQDARQSIRISVNDSYDNHEILEVAQRIAVCINSMRTAKGDRQFIEEMLYVRE